MAALSQTAANVLKSSSGAQAIGTIAAATTVVAGNALYQLANGTYGLASATGTAPLRTFAGFALTGGGAGQPVVFCSADSAFVPGCTMTIGKEIYLSLTAGAITETVADITSGATAIPLGNATSTTVLNLAPLVGGIVP